MKVWGKKRLVSAPKIACIVSCLLLTACLSLVSGLLFSKTASAVDMTLPPDRVKSLQYYYAVEQCLSPNYSITSVGEGKIGDGRDKVVGHLIDEDQGKQECGTLLPAAISFWGYSTVEDALKNWGYKIDGNFWKNPSKQGFRNDVRAKMGYGSNLPRLDNSAQYALYAGTFIQACEATERIEVSKANDSIKAQAARHQNGYVQTTVVEGKPPKAIPVIYKVSNLTSAISIAESPGENGLGLDSTSAQCVNIAERMERMSGSYLTWAKNNLEKYDASAIKTDSHGKDADSTEKSTCTIDGVGWMVCPVVKFMAMINDQAYKLIAEMLTVRAFTSTSGDTQLKTSWSAFRNIANVCFIAAFLVIIFSMVSSIGISNYHLKKMLPKLILTAVMVNTSYWLCAAAVDVSNILGASVKGFLEGSGAFTPFEAADTSNFATSKLDSWQGITGSVIAASTGAYALYTLLPSLLVVLVSALLAVLVTILTLMVRQALIILLIVISPLAFVAYLLPNTESWFKKWWKVFWTLLLMYPIISLLFGASSLASTIVMASAGGGSGAGSEVIKTAIQIMGAGITVIPLFITPILVKSAAGVLGRFGGFLNNPNRGPFDALRRRAEQGKENMEGRRAIRALNNPNPKLNPLNKYQRAARREAIAQGIKAEQSRSTSNYVAKAITGSEAFRSRVAGGGIGEYNQAPADAMQRALARATLTVDKATAETIEAESVTLRDNNAKELKEVINSDNSSAERKAAAMQRLIKISDPADYAKELNAIMAQGSAAPAALRRTTADTLAKENPGFLKASDIDNIATGRFAADPEVEGSTATTLEQITERNVASGVISQDRMVNATTGSLEYAYQHSNQMGRERLRNTAHDLINNENVTSQIRHNIDVIHNLAGNAP